MTRNYKPGRRTSLDLLRIIEKHSSNIKKDRAAHIQHSKVAGNCKLQDENIKGKHSSNYKPGRYTGTDFLRIIDKSFARTKSGQGCSSTAFEDVGSCKLHL